METSTETNFVFIRSQKSVIITSLQHHHNIIATSSQCHCNVTTLSSYIATSSQHHCNVTATSLQLHCNITATTLSDIWKLFCKKWKNNLRCFLLKKFFWVGLFQSFEQFFYFKTLGWIQRKLKVFKTEMNGGGYQTFTKIIDGMLEQKLSCIVLKRSQ